MQPGESGRLNARDRVAFRFRVAGALVGLAVIAWAFATSSWGNEWVIALLVVLTFGGAVAYHILTSVVRCPSCTNRVANWHVSSVDADRKLFLCGKCGTSAYLKEGFFWQKDWSG